MAVLAATNGAMSSLQSALLRSRIAAARRDVEQAESYAQSLRRQTEAQENVVQQGQRRVKAVENTAQTPTSNSTKASAPAPRPDPTYINALAEVFQAAKPILESDLSPVQKNIVESDLLARTNKAWTSSQPTPPSPAPYQSTVFQSPSQTIGRVLDASA
jgi:Tfp pilus assembly protein PilX